MKKNYLLWAVTALIMLALQSCNNGKTYAEMKEEEADAINKYILENDIKVISEADFAAQDSTTKENEYVLLEESGVYMHVDNRGPGKEVLGDGAYEKVECICMWIIVDLVKKCWEMERMKWLHVL